MKLILKNFKCWESAEFEISENGITLLSGNSGCGKTSVLQAIYFALYDKGTKLVRIGSSSCRVELEGFGVHVVRTKKPNRLVVDGKYEDEAGQAVIDRKFGRNFNVVSYIEQDAFKSLVYMTPASRLEFMENFAFESVDIERVKSNLKQLIRQSEDARLKAQTEFEFHTRNFSSQPVPAHVPRPDLDRPAPEAVQLNSEEMDSLVKKKSDLQRQLVQVQKQAKEAADAQETLQRLHTEIADLERRVVDVGYCGDIEYNLLADRLKKAVCAREYINTKKKYDELSQTYRSLKADEENAYKTRVEQLRSKLWTGTGRDETVNALASARKQAEINKEYTVLSARINTLQHSVDEYNALLPLSGVLATCPGCACSVSIVDGTSLLLSSQRDESAVMRIHALKPLYTEYTRVQQRLACLDYRDVDLESLETYFSENDNCERQLASLATFTPSPTLTGILREGKEIKTRLDRFVNVDVECETDEFSLRDRLSEQKGRKDIVELLVSQITAKKNQCPTAVATDTYYDAIRELETQISAVESQLCQLYKTAQTQINLEKAWHEYDSFVSKQEVYATLHADVARVHEALKQSEQRYENVQRLKDIVSLSESECLASIVNTINIHAQQFVDAFFPNNPLSAQLVTFKDVKSGRTTVSKPQLDLRIEYKGQDTDLASLSGGERARLSLAFTLALAEIYNHPLLMLDESISSLDYESTVDVVQAIKEILVDKTVLIVSHQANTGIFDYVLNF